MITNIPNERISYFRSLRFALSNRQLYSIMFLIISSVLIFFSISILGAYMHENVHKAINAQYGMDSEIGWNFGFPAVIFWTKAIVPANYSFGMLCTETCATSHINNEIVSYNLEGLINLLLCLFVIGGIYYHFRNFDEEEFMNHMCKCKEEYEIKKWMKQNPQLIN